MKRLDSLNQPEYFQAWFNRIVSRRCYDYLRKKKSSLFTDLENEDGDMIDWVDDREDACPDLVLDHQETIKLVAEMIDSLPQDQRLCVIMYYRDNLSVSQIAKTLGISEGTVKSRLSYARRKVKTKVEALEKQGVKLYSVAPIPLLIWLLKYETSYADIPAFAATAPLVASTSAAGAATSGSSTGAFAGTSATAAKTGLGALAAKVVAGVAAVSVAIGGASYYFANERDGNVAKQEYEVVQGNDDAARDPDSENDFFLQTQPEAAEKPETLSEHPAAAGDEEKLYKAFLTEGISTSGFVPLYYTILDINLDGTCELIIADADGTPDSWTTCEMYTCDDGNIVYCGSANANYNYLFHANEKYLIGPQRMGFNYIAVDEEFSTSIYYWNEEQTRNDPAIIYQDGTWKYITAEEFEFYNTLPGEGSASYIQKADRITLQENTFLKRNLLAETLDFTKAWAVYEDFNGERYVTCYAFTEAGKVYCAVGPDLSMWLGYYMGTYSLEEDRVSFHLESEGAAIDYVYRFDPHTLQFTQISENGFFHSHEQGETLQLQEFEWSNAAEMIRTIFNGDFED